MPDYCHAVSIRIPPPELLNMNWPEIPDRQLVELCLEGSEDAWAELLRRFHRLIASVLARTVRPWFPVTPDLLEDLHQDVLAKICTNDFRALRELEWRHDGALRGLLQVTAASVAQDYVRRRLAQSRDARLEEQLDELKHDRGTKDSASAREHKIMLEQLAKCLEKLIHTEPDHRRDIAMFLLYYGCRVTAADLARLYHLGIRAVENTVARLSRIAREHCIQNQ
jgi:DNA-directed RNA polymerase specialized sigma24 family protein